MGPRKRCEGSDWPPGLGQMVQAASLLCAQATDGPHAFLCSLQLALSMLELEGRSQQPHSALLPQQGAVAQHPRRPGNMNVYMSCLPHRALQQPDGLLSPSFGAANSTSC